MKKITSLLLGGFLLLGAVACSDTAKTSADAPNSTKDQPQAAQPDSTKAAQDDATSGVRQKQLESDTRARDQRTNAGGDAMNKADSDLASQVRDKLEAGIPSSQLTVDSKDGAVTIAGTVPSQDQVSKIQPLAEEVQGVKSVTVKATVGEAAPK